MPGERLRFEVIEPVGIEDGSVRLVGGRCEFEEVGPHTRVTLTTTYEPLLSPRFIWRLIEHQTVHVLHQHVLEGMQMEATRMAALASTGTTP